LAHRPARPTRDAAAGSIVSLDEPIARRDEEATMPISDVLGQSPGRGRGLAWYVVYEEDQPRIGETVVVDGARRLVVQVRGLPEGLVGFQVQAAAA
jgi:hypothetical protein